MDKVLSSGNSLTHSPENSQCLRNHIIRNLSVLGSPADWSQRGLVLRLEQFPKCKLLLCR